MRAAVATVLLALVACSAPSSSGGDGGTSAPTVSDACTTRAHSTCAKLSACSPFELQTRYGDAAACEARQLVACENGLAAPDTGRTPEGDVACATALDAESCSDFLNTPGPDACQTPAGKRANGAVCFSSAQCQSAFCGFEKDATCGSCMAAPGVGQSCAVFSCAKGLTCTTAGSQICAAPSSSGGACGRDLPCGPGLTCVGFSAGHQGTCEPDPTTAGGTCDPHRAVAPLCDRRLGLFCTNNACASVSYAAPGQACNAGTESPIACLGGALCVVSDDTTKDGSCVAPVDAGKACDTVNGPPCLAGLRCVPTTAGQTAGTCLLVSQTQCP